MKEVASSERRSLNLFDGMESRLLQDPNLPIPESALFRDFHKSLEDVVITLPLHAERAQAVAGRLTYGESRQILHALNNAS